MLDLVLSPIAILAGCALLYVGGDMLVSASTFIANRIGMSPIAIGATIVAIGTSAPELSVSLDAALSGHSDVSVGNIVGSNVCNIILVLGLCGLFSHLRASREVVRIDFPILIVVSGIFTWMISDGVITRTEGFALISGLVVYVIWNLRRAAESSGIHEYLTEEVAEALGQWPELALARYLPGTTIIRADTAAARCEHRTFNLLQMRLRNVTGYLEHRLTRRSSESRA